MGSQSFTDFLEAYGHAHPPRMRYREGDDFAAWQAAFREKLAHLRGPTPERIPLRVEVVDTVEEDDHTRQVLDIAVNAFSSLTAYLLVPRGLAPGEKRPGLIASHGHGLYGADGVCGIRSDPKAPSGGVGRCAVRDGYVVLAPGWWGWTGRDGHLAKVGSRDKCNAIQMAASMYGLSVLSLHIQDAQAAVDVLAARPEVDAERIGCLGNSYGGRTTMWFVIFDPRIKACAPSGCMNLFRERSLKLSSCGLQYFHGLLQYGDVPELLSLIAPRPMQLQAGLGDGLITPADRDLIERTVRRAYALLGAEELFEYVLHEEGHRLVWPLAKTFFDRRL